MCLNHKILVFILLLLLNSQIVTGVDVHPVELRGGLSVWIDPDETRSKAVLIVHFMKSPAANRSKLDIYSEFVWHSIQQQFEQLNGETEVFPVKWLPDEAYNWRENRFLIFRADRHVLNENMNKILEIFNSADNTSPGRKLKICQQDNFTQRDSLLWMSKNPYSLSKFCAAADSVKRNDLEEFYRKEENHNRIQLYITGNFDQQYIIPYILTLADSTREHKKIQIVDSVNDDSDAIRMMFDPDYYLLSLKLPPVEKETILGEFFLINAIKKYFSGRLAENEIYIYYPWSSGSRELTLMIRRDRIEPDFVDDLKEFLIRMNNVDTLIIKNWFYSDHLVRIRDIYTNFEKNKRLSMMMYQYLDDAGYLFDIYMPAEFPANEVQQAVREILRMNHLVTD